MVDEWDYVVVGGGSSGSVVAARLSEQPGCRVLLLDAGRDDRHLYTRIPAGQMKAFPRPDMNWLFTAEPDPSRESRVDLWPAGRIIGGGSAINGMMYVRGHRWDYDHWADLGNSGWSYSDVKPFFQRLESSDVGTPDSRGFDGPQPVNRVAVSHPLTDAFIEAAREAGIPFNPDLNGDNQEGVGYCQATQKRGWRMSAARAYLPAALKRDNFELRLGAQVERVLFEGKRAAGVVYRGGDASETTVSARRGVVICAGAMMSPKLLMLSGIGDPAQLAEYGIERVQALPGVGQNLQEHPLVRMSFHVRNAETLTSDLNSPWRSFLHGLNYVFRGRGALSTCIGHAQALVHTRPGLSAPNAQIIFAPLSYDLTENGPVPYRVPAVGLGVGLCRIQSRGRVGLRDGRVDSAPLIEYSLLDNPDDVAQLREAMKVTREIFAAPSLARYVEDERLPGAGTDSEEALDRYIRSQSGLMFHPCGTCKMGTDVDAVVDPTLRVRGLQGLWVADASIFPTVPAGNINATCLMVGEKAAELVAQSEHRSEPNR